VCCDFPFCSVPCELQIGLEAGTDLRKSLSSLFPCETLSSLPLSVYNSVSVSCFYFCLAVQGNEDKMHLITQSCVLFLWMHSLTFVKGQGKPKYFNFVSNHYIYRLMFCIGVGHKILICISCPTECTLRQFLNSNLYDPNFDTSGLAGTYDGGKQVRVGCNVGFSGFFKLICTEGKWESKGTRCTRELGSITLYFLPLGSHSMLSTCKHYMQHVIL